MSGLQLRAGFSERGAHPKQMTVGIEIPSLMVSLSETADSTARWRIRIEVKTETTRKTLGTVITIPPASGADPNRVIAVASCPGAIGWFVDGRLEPNSGDANSEAIVELASSMCCSSLGIQPTSSSILLPPETTLVSDVAGPNPVFLPSGVKLLSLTARAGPAGGSITFNPGIVIGVEANDSFRFDPTEIVGPVTITFTTMLRWVIERSA